LQAAGDSAPIAAFGKSQVSSRSRNSPEDLGAIRTEIAGSGAGRLTSRTGAGKVSAEPPSAAAIPGEGLVLLEKLGQAPGGGGDSGDTGVGALLHDIGKPATFRAPDPAVPGDRIRFNGHVEVGVRIAR